MPNTNVELYDISRGRVTVLARSWLPRVPLNQSRPPHCGRGGRSSFGGARRSTRNFRTPNVVPKYNGNTHTHSYIHTYIHTYLYTHTLTYMYYYTDIESIIRRSSRQSVTAAAYRRVKSTVPKNHHISYPLVGPTVGPGRPTLSHRLRAQLQVDPETDPWTACLSNAFRSAHRVFQEKIHSNQQRRVVNVR